MEIGPAVEWSMAQLSDPHVVEPGRLLVGVVDTSTYLRAALATVAALSPAPDLVVISGDLVDSGRAEQYRHLSEHLTGVLSTMGSRLLLMPGNHDHTGVFRESIAPASRLPTGATEHAGPFVDVVVDGPVRVLALDTARGPAAGGELDESQLRWLDEQLSARPRTPAVVLMHHPPFATGIAHMDAMALDATSSASLAAVIAGHPQVERINCGHLHRTISRRFAGTVAATVPSTAHAVRYDLTGGAPGATLEPPAVTVLAWGPEIGLVAHQRAIGEFPPLPAPEHLVDSVHP